MTASGGSIPRREPNDDGVLIKISPAMYSLDNGDTWHEGDIYDLPIPWMPIRYWLKPKNWPGEASCWLAQHGWTNYCHVHDRIHRRWTHRGCCGKQRSAALSALRKAGFLR